MPAVDLVVTDLDGTLWHTDDEIHPKVVAALEEVAKREVPLLVATGRRAASTRAPLARIGQAPPAVVLNGALGLHLGTGERFQRAPFPPSEATRALAAFAGLGLSPVVYVDHPRYDVFLGPTPSTHRGHVEDLRDHAGVDDLARVCAEEAVLGFGMIGIPHGQAVAARDALGDLVAVHLDRAFNYPGMASFTAAPIGQSKWDGVLAFCAAEGLDPDRVLAVADGPNDVELLTGAAVRLVPTVAHPAALELADHLIPAAADGGWAEVLGYLE